MNIIKRAVLVAASALSLGAGVAVASEAAPTTASVEVAEAGVGSCYQFGAAPDRISWSCLNSNLNNYTQFRARATWYRDCPLRLDGGGGQDQTLYTYGNWVYPGNSSTAFQPSFTCPDGQRAFTVNRSSSTVLFR